jgi:hypothetical protein
MKSHCKIVVACLCALVASGCVVTFKGPLPRSLRTTQDSRLFGKWVGRDDQGHQAFANCARDPDDQARISFSGEGSDASYLGYRNPVFRMVTTRIDSQDYMILRYVDLSKGRGFQIAKYSIKDDKLSVWILSVDRMKKAIRNDQIKGDVGTGMLPDVTITDHWSKITSLLKSPQGDDLFVFLGEVERVR